MDTGTLLLRHRIEAHLEDGVEPASFQREEPGFTVKERVFLDAAMRAMILRAGERKALAPDAVPPESTLANLMLFVAGDPIS